MDVTKSEKESKGNPLARLKHSASKGREAFDDQLEAEWIGSVRVRERFNNRFSGFQRWALAEVTTTNGVRK